MTTQPPAGDPTVEPQPLKFEPTPGDGTEATFEATIPGPGKPGAPAITLAVTVDPSVPLNSANEFNGLLGQMKAAFNVLPALPPDWNVSGDDEEPSSDGDSGSGSGTDSEEPPDFKKVLRLELKLVWPKETEEVAVAVIVTVETTAGIVPAPRESEILRDIEVTQHLDDHWFAINSPPPTARVHVTGGHGTMRRAGDRRHQTNLHIPPPNYFRLSNATAFILHAVDGAMGYTLNSGFHSPNHPNNLLAQGRSS